MRPYLKQISKIKQNQWEEKLLIEAKYYLNRLLWNKKTGKPIYKAIVWQDRRTADYCDELKIKKKDKIIQKITGLVLDPYFSATKIKWILDKNSKNNRNQITDIGDGKIFIYNIDQVIRIRTGEKDSDAV